MLLQGRVEELPKYLGRLYEIECEWKDHSIKTLPFYLLPAPGRYLVTLKKGKNLDETEVIVKEGKEGRSPQFITEISIRYKGNLSIIWNQCCSFEPILENKQLTYI